MGTKTEPKDPNVEPEGYKPPTSADELLERYANGERYFVEAQLRLADLRGACLAQAVLRGADLRSAHLHEAELESADLTGARLEGAEFIGANLGHVVLDQARWPRGLISNSTLERSRWGLREARRWLNGYGLFHDYDDMPPEIRENIQREPASWSKAAVSRDGLTLYFSTKITPLDQHIINGVIYGTVGFDRCEMVQFEQRDEGAIVRLQGADPADLVVVAEILHQRIWEHQERAQRAAVDALARLTRLMVRPEDLTATADKIEKMELRVEPGTLTSETIDQIVERIADLLSLGAIEMLWDQGAKHVQEKDSRLMMTWGQKGGRALGRTIFKKVTGEVGGMIEGEVKDAIKGLVEDEENE